MRLLLAGIATVAGLLSVPSAGADPDTCNERYESCNSPVWCETTGQYLPAFSGYCPIGPDNFPAPRLGR